MATTSQSNDSKIIMIVISLFAAFGLGYFVHTLHNSSSTSNESVPGILSSEHTPNSLNSEYDLTVDSHDPLGSVLGKEVVTPQPSVTFAAGLETRQERDQKRKQDIATIGTALESHFTQTNGKYPLQLSDLLINNHLRQLPIAPPHSNGTTSEYQYLKCANTLEAFVWATLETEILYKYFTYDTLNGRTFSLSESPTPAHCTMSPEAFGQLTKEGF